MTEPTETQTPAPAPAAPETPPATPETPPAAAAPEPGPAPWASDLAELGLPEDALPKVDQYLREKVQPRITKLEESRLPDEASELWNDLNDEDRSTDAYLSITAELYGDEVADQLEEALLALENENPEGAPPAVAPQPGEPASPAALPPEAQEAVQFYQEQQEDREYDEGVSKLVKANPGLFPDEETAAFQLAPYVDFADGDFDVALQEYRSRQAEPPRPEQIPQPGELGPEEPAAPQPLNEGGHAPGAPTTPQHESLDDAVDGLVQDLRARAAPPPVGSV